MSDDNDETYREKDPIGDLVAKLLPALEAITRPPPPLPAPTDAEMAEAQLLTDKFEQDRLRDKFAGLALTALLPQASGPCYDENEIATEAYQVADAMLKARARKEDK